VKAGTEHGGRIFAIARELGVAPEAIVDFSASINPLGTAHGVAGAVAAAMASIGHYPEIGSPGLAAALAGLHGLPEKMIANANGSTELIYLLPRLIGKPGGRALLVAPTFSEYAHSLELAGWTVAYHCLDPDNGFALDLAAVKAQLTEGFDLLFFCNPGNPTGRLYSREEIKGLYAACSGAGCFFVLDEAFMDFCEEQSAKQLLPADGGWLILRSMTKFFGFPGIRLGYSIAPELVTARVNRLLPPWSVGTLAQAAGLAALADTGHSHLTRDFVAAERARLAARLGALPGVRLFPGAANYLLLRLENGSTAAALQERLLAERLLIRDCSNFTGLDDRYFRIAVRTTTENDRLLAALGAAL
jgi:threonine-phosphate decarboxylase